MHFTDEVKVRLKTGKLAHSLATVGGRAYGMRRKLATGAVGMLAVMVGYHVVFGQNGIVAYQSKRHDASQLQMQVEQMDRENARLRSHVDHLAHDPGSIEHEAREELHYARPGEVIYTLPPKPAVAAAESSTGHARH